MVDWQSSAVLRICFESLAGVTTTTLGFFMWYIFTTFDRIELQLLTGRVKYSWWTHTPYILGRYSFLVSTTCFVIFMHWDTSGALNCEEVILLLSIFSCLALFASSFNMVTRLPAVWNKSKWMYALVVLASLAHLGLAISVPITNVDVFWDPVNRLCQERYDSGRRNGAVFYTYTVAWDAAILVLTFIGLRRQCHAWTSPVGMKIRWQGLYYIIVSVVVNFALIYFALKDLNVVMDVIISVPGGAINVIISSFMVTHLLEVDQDRYQGGRRVTTTQWQQDRKEDATTASTIVDLTDALVTRASNDTHWQTVQVDVMSTDASASLYTAPSNSGCSFISEVASSSRLPRPIMPAVLRHSRPQYDA